jgi:hypothetical protein
MYITTMKLQKEKERYKGGELSGNLTIRAALDYLISPVPSGDMREATESAARLFGLRSARSGTGYTAVDQIGLDFDKQMDRGYATVQFHEEMMRQVVLRMVMVANRFWLSHSEPGQVHIKSRGIE